MPLAGFDDLLTALDSSLAATREHDLRMSRHDKLYDKISRNPDNVRWRDFYALCELYFGTPVRRSGSHIIFKLPSWPRRGVLAIQPAGKGAKGYQVRQALRHIERIRDGHC